MAKIVAAGPSLDDRAQIHDGDAGRDLAHHAQIMSDEHIGQIEPLLQIGEQIDDLRLDRDIERRHRLVGDDQPWFERDGAGDADALALAAGEFMREAVEMLGQKARRGS